MSPCVAHPGVLFICEELTEPEQHKDLLPMMGPKHIFPVLLRMARVVWYGLVIGSPTMSNKGIHPKVLWMDISSPESLRGYALKIIEAMFTPRNWWLKSLDMFGQYVLMITISGARFRNLEQRN